MLFWYDQFFSIPDQENLFIIYHFGYFWIEGIKQIGTIESKEIYFVIRVIFFYFLDEGI